MKNGNVENYSLKKKHKTFKTAKTENKKKFQNDDRLRQIFHFVLIILLVISKLFQKTSPQNSKRIAQP